MLKRNIKGMGLLEVFITSFIFIIAVAAIFVTLNSLRKPAANNDRSSEAALVARNVLEDLRSKIDTRDFQALSNVYDGNLSIGPHWVNNIGPGGIYNVMYNVNQTTSTGALEVNASVSYPDAL